MLSSNCIFCFLISAVVQKYINWFSGILLSLQVFFLCFSSCWSDHHCHRDQGGGGEHVVHDVAADHGGVHGGDGGEHEEGDQAAEQLTGPGQARLVIQQTNVGQAPQAVGGGDKKDTLGGGGGLEKKEYICLGDSFVFSSVLPLQRGG